MKRNTFFENLDRNGLPTGGRKAYWAYKLSIEDRSNILELCDHLTEPEAVDFIDVLRKAGITQFVLTDRSTSLFATVLALTANGCTIRGTKNVVRKCGKGNKRWKTNVPGLWFKLNKDM